MPRHCLDVRLGIDYGPSPFEGKGVLRSMTRSSGRLAGIEPARVCIIKPSSLGDVVHALPILSALRGVWPSAHLTWVVNAPFREVLLGHPDLDELIVYDRRGRGIDRLGISGMAGILGKLGRGRYDLTIDLQGLLRSALMAAATGAKVRVGMADAREGARWFYTHRVDAPRLGLHAVDRVLRVAAELGADVSEPRFNLPIAEADRVLGDGRPRRDAAAAGHPEPRRALADQTLAAGALCRDRPSRGLEIRRRTDRRRCVRGSAARRCPGPSYQPRCECSTSVARLDFLSSRHSASKPI